jgi:hypothetical protein
MSLFADTIAPVRRRSADELFLIRVIDTPLPENSEASDAGGAYVNVWVDADDLRTAERSAIDCIREEHWRPTKFEHWELVCRQCYTDDSRIDEDERRVSLERVDEAFEYGVALTFHCWPIDAPDAHDEDG